MVTLNDCRQGNTHEYVGLSTDEKPTEGVGVNSLFLELDTLDIYYFNGEEWAKCGEGEGIVLLDNETVEFYGGR